jgi:hypothetical protein
MPYSMVKSRSNGHPTSPEGHLDDPVARLRNRRVGSGSRIVGLTYKDDSTLARFNCLGLVDTFRYDAAADFGLRTPALDSSRCRP